jgi:hypothetical protein
LETRVAPTYRFWWENLTGRKRLLRRSRHRWEVIRVDQKQVVNWKDGELL